MSAAVSSGGSPLSLLAEQAALARGSGARTDRLRVRSVAAGRRVLMRVSGPLNAATASALEEALRPYRSHASRLIVDLRAVEYIETPELRLLLALADELPARGGRLCLVVQPESRVARTLQLVGIQQRCPFFATAREAWTARPPAAGEAEAPAKSRKNGESAKRSENAKGTETAGDSTPPTAAAPTGFRAFASFRAFAVPSARFAKRSGVSEGDEDDTE